MEKLEKYIESLSPEEREKSLEEAEKYIAKDLKRLSD